MSRQPFEYAVLQVVPRVERDERINAGVLLYCRAVEFLGARVHLDRERLAALDPGADVAGIACALDAVVRMCGGNGEEGRAALRYAGPAGEEDAGRRFRRLTAPRSTVLQAGPVHTGLTADPVAELERLLTALVLPLQG